MKQYFLGLLFLAGSVFADVPVPPAASQAEVNAGTIHSKYVAPDTLAGWTGALSASVVTNWISATGTNDVSALVELYAASPGYIRFAPTQSDYYATNIVVTSPGVTIDLGGATLHQLFAASQYFWRTNIGFGSWYQATNFCFLLDAGATRYLPNVSVINGTLDGGQPADYSQSPYQFLLFNGANHGLYPLDVGFGVSSDNWQCSTNNWGLGFNAAAGGTARDLKIKNFGGVGFCVVGMGTPAPTGAGNHIYGVQCSSNFLSWYINGMPPASEFTTVQTNFGEAEYIILTGVSADHSAIGCASEANNVMFADASILYCWLGLGIGGDEDLTGPHTKFYNVKLNHDYCGFLIDYCDFVGLTGIYEAASTTNLIWNSDVEIDSSSFAGLGDYSTGSTPNQFTWIHNSVLNGFCAYTNTTVMVSYCMFYSPCVWNGCTLYDIGNRTALNFSYTVWTNQVMLLTDVVYYGSGNLNGITQLPDYNGQFNGNGFGLTNMRLGSISGSAPATIASFTNSLWITNSGSVYRVPVF